jgi:hypothetical protein
MKERGKYQIQCMKSRSSTGVGQKIDLEYNIETMRITDEGGEDGDTYSKKPSASIMDSIKARSQVTTAADSADTPPWSSPTPGLDTAKVSGDVQSAKLKQLLGKIKTG